MLPRRSGSIVHFASLLSYQGGLTVPAYAAAKGGIAQMVKALANEWSKEGVRVNAVVPGYIRTDMCVFLSLTFFSIFVPSLPSGSWRAHRSKEIGSTRFIRWCMRRRWRQLQVLRFRSNLRFHFRLHFSGSPNVNLLHRYHLMNRASERASGYYWVQKLTLPLFV